MVQPKKTTSAAFGDILAGLDGPQRGPAARVSSAPSSASGASMDVSWIKSAQARARAAQMAQQAAELEKEPERASVKEREKGLDPAHRLRRNLGGLSWGWRGGFGPHSSSYGPDSAGEEASASSPDAADATGASEVAEATTDAAISQHPVHALRRLLSQIPWVWWRAERARATSPDATAAEAAPRIELAPPKSEDEAIAEELGLSADLAIADLRRIRREFAKKNHPDRFEPALRVGAARRMTIANMLIDAHLKQKPH